MRLSVRIAVVVLIAVCACFDAYAQTELSDETQISLITVLPGDDIYSLWGHSAIRVFDPVSGVDVSYNYGTFNFEDDWFVVKFLYGNLMYRLARHDFTLALEHYRNVERRSVIEQVLNLSPSQRESLAQFLSINYRPENRYYAYDFLYDNCSTRVRDAFERALGSDLRFARRPDPNRTFRQLLDPYQTDWPFLDAGIDWLLGAPVDRIARPYETMFLPVYLMEAFDYASIEIDGENGALVASTDTLFWIEGENVKRAGFPWEAVVTWMVFLVGAILTIRSDRETVRYLDALLFLIVGLAGILIVFLWFISLHEVTASNWHLMWSWPTHLIAGAVFFRRDVPGWLRAYSLAAAVAALIAVLGSPLWPQAFHPALYPIMLLVAVRGGWIFIEPRRRAVTTS